MLIAREKRKNNVAEYILYMWQLEDMLRALRLDIQEVDRHIVDRFEVDPDLRREIHEWYDNLIAMMRVERVEQSGHLQVIKNMVNELTELHYHLLNQAADPKYRQLFLAAANNLLDYRRRANLEADVSDVELALHALYGQLMLRLQHREIHPHTADAMRTFSQMLAYLSARYKQQEDEDNKEC